MFGLGVCMVSYDVSPKHVFLEDLVVDHIRGARSIFRNVEYSFGGCGELDVFAVYRKPDYVVLYEVKSSPSKRALEKGRRQLLFGARYLSYRFGCPVKCLLVSSGYVERVHQAER